MKWALLLYFSSLDYVDTSLRYENYQSCYRERERAIEFIEEAIEYENKNEKIIGVKKGEKIERMMDDLSYSQQLRCVVADDNS